SHRSNLVPLLISGISRNPRVVTKAVLDNFLSINAFVPTVVPCEKTDISSPDISAFAIPSNTPFSGSDGVDGDLATVIFFVFSSKTKTSVNVPPTSTAILYLDISYLLQFIFLILIYLLLSIIILLKFIKFDVFIHILF